MVSRARLVSCSFLMVLLLLLAGCSTYLPFFSVTVKVVDEKNAPLSGATVYSSGGEQMATDAEGTAVIKFSGIGLYTIHAEADGRMPTVLTVNIPLDTGKTLTARLPKGMATASGGSAGMGMLGMNMNSLMAQMYPLMFQYLFTANGYNLDLSPYEVGQWTEWRIYTDGDDDAMTMRKAFLKRLDNRQEWWQVRIKGSGKGSKDMLFEVLFSADRQSIRRMRQLGSDGKPAEVAVSEGWYSAPQSLTPESLEGAMTKRSDAVKVPAGTYKADLYEFSAYNGKVLMWRVKSVPGGLVKSQVTDNEGDESWHSELTALGTGAKTELASY